MNVTELDKEGDLWEAYIRRDPQASFYHRLGWREVIRRSFGHRAWYLVAQDGAEIRGALPLVEMRSPLFGHFLVSLPFVNYGGILAETPEAERELAAAAVALARRQ